MSRQAFHNLLQRYLNGTCTEEEREIVEHWYAMLDNPAPAGLQSEEFVEIERRIWERISQKETNIPSGKSSGQLQYMWAKVSAAAIVLAILSLTGYYFLLHKSNPVEDVVSFRNQDDLVERNNSTNHTMSVILEDKSIVVLQPGSSLTIPAHFKTVKREVFLKGEGFFEVTKNTERPFFVYNKNTITEVVGTSFTVRTDQISDRTEVIVKTGKVVVSAHEPRNMLQKLMSKYDKVVLTPNLRTIYSSDKKEFISTLVEQPVPVAESEGKQLDDSLFVFNEASIQSVLSLLKTTYKIDIIAEDSRIFACTFTGDIAGISLYDKLELLCQSIGASYEIVKTKIHIRGGACNKE